MDGKTALHWACDAGCVRAAKYLLSEIRDQVMLLILLLLWTVCLREEMMPPGGRGGGGGWRAQTALATKKDIYGHMPLYYAKVRVSLNLLVPVARN